MAMVARRDGSVQVARDSSVVSSSTIAHGGAPMLGLQHEEARVAPSSAGGGWATTCGESHDPTFCIGDKLRRSDYQ
jgi:hypothetical protein